MACLFARDLLVKIPTRERKERARLLCERHDIGCTDYWGPSEVALSEAAQRGDQQAVEKILALKPDVNFGNDRYPRPIVSAISVRSLAMVRLLVEHGADPNLGTANATPLELAVSYSGYDIAEYLLDRGARGHVVVDLASAGDHELAAKVLDKGGDPNDGAWGGTALIFAVRNRDAAMVRILLAHCADPYRTTKFSDGSAVDHARRLHAKKILAMLLAAPAAPCLPRSSSP